MKELLLTYDVQIDNTSYFTLGCFVLQRIKCHYNTIVMKYVLEGKQFVRVSGSFSKNTYIMMNNTFCSITLYKLLCNMFITYIISNLKTIYLLIFVRFLLLFYMKTDTISIIISGITCQFTFFLRHIRFTSFLICVQMFTHHLKFCIVLGFKNEQEQEYISFSSKGRNVSRRFLQWIT